MFKRKKTILDEDILDDEDFNLDVQSDSDSDSETDSDLEVEVGSDDDEEEDKDWLESEGQLTIDVYQTEGEIVIKSAVAGVNPDDLDIDITGDTVTIRGKREVERGVSEKDYFYQECYWGKFSRSIILPVDIDSEKTTATLKNGILTVRMPKIKKDKVRKIKIKEG